MRPLYDRYRVLKRMLAQPSPEVSELQPILEDADEDCPMVFNSPDSKVCCYLTVVTRRLHVCLHTSWLHSFFSFFSRHGDHPRSHQKSMISMKRPRNLPFQKTTMIFRP